jgi:hypothetical protein
MRYLAIAAMLVVAPGLPRAGELETTHFYGFTLGSDVNAVGEIEGEFEAIGRFAKARGSYAAIEPTIGVKFIPITNFSVEPIIGAARHDISAVPGLDDRHQSAFSTVTVEMRYRIFEREHASIGLTLGFDPHWFGIDDIGGDRVDGYGADFLLIADQELVADRLFGSFNLVGAPDAQRSHVTGVWQHESHLGVSTALAWQVQPAVLLGVETQYMNSYRGLAFDALTGQALFLGPTFYARFSEKVWMSAAWSVQVAGQAKSEAGALDLTHFERQQAVIRFGYNF